MAMRYNKLGDSGLLVSELSFGSWVTFQNDGQLSEAEACLALMKEAYLGGVNFFDNAEAYGAGDAEELMGEAIRLGVEQGVWDREDLVISTKIFNERGFNRYFFFFYTKLFNYALAYVFFYTHFWFSFSNN